MRPPSSAGFTLIEILMVLVLVAILSRMAISQFVNFNLDAQTQVTKDKLNSLKTAIIGDARLVSAGKYSKQGYESHCLGPPAAVLTDLNTMPAAGTCSVVYDPFTKRGWRGPYVSTAATDPNWNKDAWGTTITYTFATRTIKSCGPDAVCGNADDISVTF